MPRFVVLEHDWPEPHLDLFLDAGDALRAWKLPAHFSPDIPATILANAQHRRHYLDYEGAVAGNRGVVLRWDFGDFDWIEDSQESVRVNFTGTRLRGMFEFARSDSGDWIFRKV